MKKTPIEHAQVENSALVVVDVQGRLARLMHESEAMIHAQQVLIQACRLLEIPVVWAEQLPDKLGSTVDELQQALDGLQPGAKSSFGCMGDSKLRERIEQTGRGQILLCGIETHVCVWQTAAALIDKDYSVHLIADATSSRSVFNRDIAFGRMQRAGVHLSNLEMVLFELMQNATHEHFREISRLLK
ncbi:MAG: isochorismatase family protein [Wenzhouxiangellaceae bacterium]|nr:isochorismatase family protein [Wenzhouxiangellaceae bacterium]